MIPECVNSFRILDTPKKTFIYAFITLHFYGALLSFAGSARIQSNVGDLRYVYYLIKMVFTKNDAQLSNNTFLQYMANIFCTLNIAVDSILMSNIDRNIKCEIYGDIEITKDRVTTSFLNQSNLNAYNVVEYTKRIGRNIQEILIFESTASYSRCSRALMHKVKVLKTTIVIVLKGEPDMFTMIFISSLFDLRKIPTFRITDGDLAGFQMNNRLTVGAHSSYRYLNADLSISHAIRKLIQPFEFILPHVGFLNLSNADIQDYKTRIEKTITQYNTFDKLDGFDFRKELCENLVLSLIFGRKQPGSSVSSVRMITFLNELHGQFTLDQLTLSKSSGLAYFTFRNDLETFWELKYPPLTHEHANKFIAYGTPSVYVNRFIRIFKLRNQTQLILYNPIFNSRLNRHYTCPTASDLQIIQTSPYDYFLIHFDTVNGEKIVNIYGLTTNQKYDEYQIHSIVDFRYSPNRIIYNQLQFSNSKLSGLICCKLLVFLSDGTDFNAINSINDDSLLTWFETYIN